MSEQQERTDQETQDLAKSMGWVDEDKFRGDKSRWVDADTFVEKGMNDLPILRERLKAQSSTITEMKNDFTEFKTHHENAVNSEYQRAMRELEEKQLKTVEEGDTEEYKRIHSEKIKLANERAATNSNNGSGQAAYEAWKRDSEWFEKDEVLTTYAQGKADKIAADFPELRGKPEFLDKLEEEVKKAFPDKFQDSRFSPAAVESGGRAPGGQRTAFGYNNLPPDAKAACDKFVRQGLITREQYVKEYEWE